MIIGLISRGGCPCQKIALQKRKLVKRGTDALSVASCIRRGTPVGIHARLLNVSLQTKQGNQRKALKPEDKPEVCFALCEGDKVEAVYA